MKCLRDKSIPKTISKAESSAYETDKAINIISQYLRICGIYITEDPRVSKKRKCLQILYSSCITTVITILAIRLIWLIDRPASLDDYLAQYIAYACSQYHILALNIIYVWRFNKQLPQLRQRFRDFEIKYGLSIGSMWMLGRARSLSLCTCMGSVVIIVTIMCAVGFISGFRKILVPFDSTSGWAFWATNTVINLLSLPGISQYGILSVLFFITCGSLIKEFERITKMLREDDSHVQSEMLSTDLECAVKTYPQVGPLTSSEAQKLSEEYHLDVVVNDNVHREEPLINSDGNIHCSINAGERITVEKVSRSMDTIGGHSEGISCDIAQKRKNKHFVNPSYNLNPRIGPRSIRRSKTLRTPQMEMKNYDQDKIKKPSKHCTMFTKGNQISRKLNNQSYTDKLSLEVVQKELTSGLEVRVMERKRKTQNDLIETSKKSALLGYDNQYGRKCDKSLDRNISCQIGQSSHCKVFSSKHLAETDGAREHLNTKISHITFPDSKGGNLRNIDSNPLQDVLDKSLRRTSAQHLQEYHINQKSSNDIQKQEFREDHQCLVEHPRDYKTKQTSINKIPEKHPEKQKQINERLLHRIIQQHAAVCYLVSEINKVFQYYLLVVISFLIPSICFLAVSFTNGSIIPKDHLISTVLFTGLNGLYGFMIVLIPATLNSVAHAPLQDLVDMDVRHLTSGGYRMYNVFVKKLSTLNIGLSLYGFIVMQKSTILTILGTLLTYMIVIIQFKPDGTGQKCVDLLEKRNYTL